MKFRLLIFSVIYIFIWELSAQTISEELWTSCKTGVALNKSLKIDIDQSWRFRNGISKETFTELGFKIKVTKLLGTFFNFRFKQNGHIFNTTSFENRFNFGFKIRTKKPNHHITFKSHYQTKNSDLYYQEFIKHSHLWRNKIEFLYKLKKKVRPYLGFETFLDIADKDSYISKVRFYNGVRFKLKKRQQLKAFAIYEKDVQVADPKNTFIVGLCYKLDIKLD